MMTRSYWTRTATRTTRSALGHQDGHQDDEVHTATRMTQGHRARNDDQGTATRTTRFGRPPGRRGPYGHQDHVRTVTGTSSVRSPGPGLFGQRDDEVRTATSTTRSGHSHLDDQVRRATQEGHQDDHHDDQVRSATRTRSGRPPGWPGRCRRALSGFLGRHLERFFVCSSLRSQIHVDTPASVAMW
jgi:hypothetical protein